MFAAVVAQADAQSASALCKQSQLVRFLRADSVSTTTLIITREIRTLSWLLRTLTVEPRDIGTETQYVASPVSFPSWIHTQSECH